MVAFLRSFAGASRTGARMTPVSQAVLPRNLSTTAYRMATPNKNPDATGSESAVHAEKNNDDDPATLQKKTANEAQRQHKTENSSSKNDVPTHSEDFVQADRNGHDPLPDHKKKSSSKA